MIKLLLILIGYDVAKITGKKFFSKIFQKILYNRFAAKNKITQQQTEDAIQNIKF
jgi:hypothetical protein